jgi:uncharacterized membrane protein YeaQ/YmgE (transglycosylase-associated protein family)
VSCLHGGADHRCALHETSHSLNRFGTWLATRHRSRVEAVRQQREARTIKHERRRNRMYILWMIIFGAIVGAIAKLIMPGRDPGGIIVTIVLGILGSIVGGFLLGLLMPGRSTTSPAGWIGSILGAVVLLWIYRMVIARRTPPTV